MLEVRDLYRRYTPKKGKPVVALNKVSLRFPDHGLIFILGKSGSGKSTLLNVMGGLDKADGGEIIIKGKSSKNFTQSDFDSYRNTYLGFIFQEYNILDEFNVGQNIALALQLQGKKATSEDINRILADVDLEGYGNRKTNELSGGQKQRVAIARALVKSPEIIFADEPTGALDSKTGLAVFETLKKLSENKLVVVVSHDREFAEMFGDRVIELADGEVISDIEKTKINSDVKSKGISIVDGTILRIEKDYVLTDNDLNLIADYLNKTKNERIISISDHLNESVKHIARIDELGNKDTFVKTDETSIVNKPGNFNAISSKLSLAHCFKIGTSSLKVKPFRLLITILLSIVAFGMFGLADTMGSYKKIEATINSMNDTNVTSLILEKNSVYEDNGYTRSYSTTATDNDIQTIKDKYGIDMKGVLITKSSYSNSINISYNYKNSLPNTDAFSVATVPGLLSSNSEEIDNLGFEIVAGKYPERINEVAITSHIYESFTKYGYGNYNGIETIIEPHNVNYESIIGKRLILNDNEFIITAIIDTKFDTSNYLTLRNLNPSDSNALNTYMLVNQYRAACDYGYHCLIYTNEPTIDFYKKVNKIYVEGTIEASLMNYNLYYGAVSKYTQITDKTLQQVVLKDNKQSLSKYETTMSISHLRMMLRGNQELMDLFRGIEITDNPILNIIHHSGPANLYWIIDQMQEMDFSNMYFEDTFEEAMENGFDTRAWHKELLGTEYTGEITEGIQRDVYRRYLEMKNLKLEDNEYVDTSLFEYGHGKMIEVYENLIDEILDLISSPMVRFEIYNRYMRDSPILDETSQFTYVGLSIFDDESVLYLSDELFEQVTIGRGYYTYLLSPLPNDEELVRQIIVDSYSIDSTDESVVYTIENEVMPAFDSINSTIEGMASIFLWIGVGFAVFASLMLFNFITISISYKKREIGILRAVGARSKDVFNIFLAESFVITMISYTFAMIVTFAVSIFLNVTLRNDYNLIITLLSPGIRQIALVLAVCLLVAFVSTFIPVYNIAMKRPIDAIQNR